MLPNLDIENNYPNKIIAGIDEVGVGALAGPLVASAVIINRNIIIPQINDSKKLSKKQLNELYLKIITHYQYSFSIINSKIIDMIGLRESMKMSYLLAIQNLKSKVDVILVDGNMKFQNTQYVSIIKGDNVSLSIAASSIVAKVIRDKIMYNLHTKYPEYSWNKNVGYGTQQHIQAIIHHGLSKHHRKSYKIKTII